MICTTIKEGTECPFMLAAGCSYEGGVCNETVEQCDGCSRRAELSSGWYCSSCPDPAAKWKVGNCNLATHVKIEVEKSSAKLNPIKASKRK